jgi:Site-specific recombinase XerD
VRVKDLQTGALSVVDDQLDRAFWRWAAVEVLRHTGMRIEELVELTHLSVRQYQRPNGEVIALLVIAPSKTDRERVIPMSAELFHVIAQIIRRHTTGGRAIHALPRYDSHEKIWLDPMPFLFQRRRGSHHSVVSPGTIGGWLRDACAELAETNPAFAEVSFTPHDFRRLFATDIVNSGLPIHIGAALLGHLDIQTTRGYIAVFNEDVVRHYQDFLSRRRATRPDTEYRTVNDTEWVEFEEHFDRRKVELGVCARPYGTSCQHEHACVRCPMLHIDPKMLPRLNELKADLLERRERAEAEQWLGEIEGIDLTLTFLDQKHDQATRQAQRQPVHLGLPAIPARTTR